MQQGARLLLLAVFLRYLDANAFGCLALASISADIFQSTVSGPLGNALRRYYYHPEYSARSSHLVFGVMTLGTVLSAVLAVVWWTLAPWGSSLLSADVSLISAVRYFSFCVPLLTITTLAGAFLQLTEQARYYVAGTLVAVGVNAMIVVPLLVWTDLGLVAVVVGQVCGLLAQAALYLPAVLAGSEASRLWPFMQDPVRYGLATLPSSYASLLQQSSDRYCLSVMGSFQMVGIYAFGGQLARVLTTVVYAPLLNGLWPSIRQREKNLASQLDYIRCASSAFVITGMFAVLLLSALSPALVEIVAGREEYRYAAYLLPVLAFSQLFFATSNLTAAGISLGHRPSLLTALCGTSVIVNILLNIALIPPFGLLGAAAGTATAAAIDVLIGALLSRRLHGLRIDLGTMAVVTLIGIVLLCFQAAANHLIDGWLAGIVLNLAIALVFPAVISCLRRTEEFRRVWWVPAMNEMRSSRALGVARGALGFRR